MAKIEAKTVTETTTKTITEIVAKTTIDLRDVATSTRKRIIDYKSIQTRNKQKRKKLTKASLITI